MSSDIDIDLADRTEALKLLKHIPASIVANDGSIRKHASGVYPTLIPVDPATGWSTIDYKEAEERNYYKIDFLNNSVYEKIKDETHLMSLMSKEPLWGRLLEEDFCKQLVHIGNHYKRIVALKEPINSVARLAMFLALIRPGKQHLFGKTWKEISLTIWDKTDNGFYFKRSHSVAYSHLIVVHMNLINEQEQNSMRFFKEA